MPTKGHKSQRGKPEFYETLKQRYNLTLTPTGAEGLDAIASSLGISRSELVERIGRGIYPVVVTSGNTPNLDADYAIEMGKPLAS